MDLLGWLLGMPWSAKRGAVPVVPIGPCCVERMDACAAGAEASDVFSAGSEISGVFISGAEASSVGCGCHT